MKRIAVFKITVFLLGILYSASEGYCISQEKRADSTDFPSFKEHLIDRFPGGYTVSSADINGDGLKDIIGLSTKPSRLVWYENPTWKKHHITTKTSRNIAFALYDIDNDGRLDCALASEFEMRGTVSGGDVHWLRCPDDPTREWTLFPVHSEPTSHRLIWIDFDGDSRKELISAPIMGRRSQAPYWNVGVNLTYYSIPDHPGEDTWEALLLDNRLTVLHGISVVDLDGNGIDDILTASFEGIHLFKTQKIGSEILWEKHLLGTGDQSLPERRGASEVAYGSLSGFSFVASIEPWHGDNVVVYTPGSAPEEIWKRNIIDDTFHEGHALITADIDGDGNDEIIAGYRGSGASLFIYKSLDPSGKSWRRIPLDSGGMATSGLCADDINNDGRLDVIAVGSSTSNIKYYENLGNKKRSSVK